jgi:GMP synthase-like glutamine amidotransferase
VTTLGLLLVGHVDPASLHVGGDYPELFGDLLTPVGIELQTFRCDEGELPASLDDCDGWLCSPSRASVYDGHAWIADVEEVIRSCVALERPYVGICFGHQLLAQALGGRVERATSGWGIGAHEYEVTQPQPWMRPAQRTVRLAASHQDQVIVAPSGTVVLARSEHCPIGGLVVGERAWSIQTHPEFTAPLAESLLRTRWQLFAEDQALAARDSLAASLDRGLVATWIAEFLRS